MRHVNALLYASVCALAGMTAYASDAPSMRVALKIEPQPVRTALKEFSDQAGVQVLLRVDNISVDGVVVPKVSGEMTVQAALNQLLGNSGLKYEFVNERTVRISAAATESSKSDTAGEESKRPLGVTRAQSESPQGTEANEQSQKSSPAGAEESISKLEEIVVTAQKREERLKDVPVPVSTVSGEQLTRHSQLRIEDYYRTIPGLAIQPQGNNGEPALSIRGISAIGKANPTVGIVVDEISYGASVVTGPNAVTAADIDPGDIARVEVLRGPQGTLYGASSIGGLLKFVTVDPSTEEFSGRVQMGTTSIEHGSGLGHTIRGSLNAPLGDTFAVRISGFTTHDPGYIDNVETGERDVNDRDSDGGRVSVLWRPADDWSVKLSGLKQKTERGGVADSDTRLGKDAFKQAMLTGTGLYDRDSEVYSATVVGRLGPAELTSATGFSKDDTFHTLEIAAFSDAVTGLASAFFPGSGRGMTQVDREVEKFSQELRLSMPLGGRVNWLAGVFYTKEEVGIYAPTFATDSNARVIGTLAFNDYGFNEQSGPATYEETALFTTLTVDLSDRWDIQAGGRYSENSQILPATFGGPLIGALYPSNPYTTPYSKSEDSAFTYLVTPRLKVSDDLMVYARFASGYRPGGINVGCGHPQIPCAYDSDTSRNAEVGLKGSALDGDLSFDLSVYHVKWSEMQIADLITNDFQFFYTINAPSASSNGVELSFDTKLSNALKLSAWVALSDAKLDKTIPFSPFGLIGQAGDVLPFTARVSSSLSLDWQFPLGAIDGNLGGTLSYVGERSGNLKQYGGAPVPPTPAPPPIASREYYPGYTQLDLYAGATYGSWNVNFFINNVTEERGILRNGSDYGNPVEYVMFIKPRTFGVSLSKSF